MPVSNSENRDVPELKIELDESDINKPVNLGGGKKGMPLGLKIGIPVSILVAVVVLSIVFKARDNGVDKTPTVESEVSEYRSLGGVEKPHDIAVAKKSNKIINGSLISDTIMSEIDELKIKISDLVSNVESISNDGAILKSKDNYIENKVDDLTKKIDSLNNDDYIIDVVNRLDAVVLSLNKLTNTVNDNKINIYKIKKTRPDKPPFLLLSIDKWDGVSSAVIELNGKSAQAVIGDIRAGWRISRIDKVNCINAVRLSDSLEAEICRSGDA